MAKDFLIALTTAFGSAAVILIVLRIVLKATKPNAFDEKIKPRTVKTQHSISKIQTGTLLGSLQRADVHNQMAVKAVQIKAPSLGGIDSENETQSKECPPLRRIERRTATVSR